MEEQLIRPVRPRKDMGKGNYGYTSENWVSSQPYCVIRKCPCGNKEFRVYSNHGDYETWVECTKCGGKAVVHDG